LILDAEGDVDSVVGNGDDDDEDEDDDCGRHRSCGQRHHQMMMMIMDTQIPTLVFNLSTKDSVTVSARSFVSWPATISVFLML